MPIGLINLITTQKVLRTWSVKGMKQHYLGSNPYISMSFPGVVRPGIRSDNMKNVCLHIQGGKLYGIRTTSHMLYEIDIFLKGLNPSLVKPSLTLRGSYANEGFALSKFFQAKESTRCLIISPLMQPSTCHFM